MEFSRKTLLDHLVDNIFQIGYTIHHQVMLYGKLTQDIMLAVPKRKLFTFIAGSKEILVPSKQMESYFSHAQ